jgi:hypothetical protein
MIEQTTHRKRHMMKRTYEEIDTMMRRLVDASYKKHGSYAHAAGMMQAQMTALLAHGDVFDRKDMIRGIERLIVELESNND